MVFNREAFGNFLATISVALLVALVTISVAVNLWVNPLSPREILVVWIVCGCLAATSAMGFYLNRFKLMTVVCAIGFAAIIYHIISAPL